MLWRIEGAGGGVGNLGANAKKGKKEKGGRKESEKGEGTGEGKGKEKERGSPSGTNHLEVENYLTHTGSPGPNVVFRVAQKKGPCGVDSSRWCGQSSLGCPNLAMRYHRALKKRVSRRAGGFSRGSIVLMEGRERTKKSPQPGSRVGRILLGGPWGGRKSIKIIGTGVTKITGVGTRRRAVAGKGR